MAKKTVISVLIKARDMVAGECRWIQGAYQKKKEGKNCWCAAGAVNRACTGRSENNGDPLAHAAFKELADDRILRKSLNNGSGGIADVIGYNDNLRRKQKQIVALFDRTIKRLQKAQVATA